MSETQSIYWSNTVVKLGELKPWANNPKTSTKRDARALLRSWDELGQFQTIAIGPDGSVYDGHQRLSALLAVNGPNYQIEARQSSRPLTDEERRKIALYSRQIGAWNWDELANWQPAELMEWGGFDAETLKDWKRDVAALDNFLKSEQPEPQDAEPQVDRAAELNEKWQVKTGDLWRIGEHRLLCGDSTKREDAERVMGGERARLVFTSPPYNQGDGKGGTLNKRTYGKTLYQDGGDDRTPQEYQEFCRQILENCAFSILENGCIAWNVSYNTNDRQSFIKVVSDFSQVVKLRETVVWEKSLSMTIHGPNFTRIAEFIFIFCNDAPYMNKEKEACEKNLWKISNVTGDVNTDEHAACFPVELPAKAIGLFSKQNEVIYEPFAGSGTTIVACQNLSRKCRAIEISPNYCAVILERMAQAFPELEIKRL